MDIPRNVAEYPTMPSKCKLNLSSTMQYKVYKKRRMKRKTVFLMVFLHSVAHCVVINCSGICRHCVLIVTVLERNAVIQNLYRNFWNGSVP